ncbi:MAG: polysaccharide pyruvyl transferase family protein [Bacteroidota bacterium]
MIKIIKNKIVSFVQLLIDNRPKIYWWSLTTDDGIHKENFGDFLNPYIVEKLTGKKPKLFYPKSKFSFFFKHALMIGSVINKSNSNSIVWGSGIISKNDKIKGGKFVAVRGPRTAERLNELSFNAPNIYGDPALLLPLIYEEKKESIYKIGVIPHFLDFEELNALNYNKSKVLFIDLLNSDVEFVINQILACEKIISTSLHGLIVAHAYQIPAMWWKYSKLNGDDVKFYDYFESALINVERDYQGFSFDEIIKVNDYCLPKVEVVNKIQKDLLSVFPYKLIKRFKRN